MSTAGRKLLSSIVVNSDLNSFINLGLTSQLFKEGENHLFKFITEHVQKFGVIPQQDTIEEKLGDVLTAATEPAEYYMDEVERRFLHTRMKSLVIEAGEMLNTADPTKAFEFAMAKMMDLHQVRNRHNLFDFKDSAQAVYKQYMQTKASGDNAGIPFGLPTLDAMTGGLVPGDFCSIVGRPACLSGDTVIHVSRKGKDGSGRAYTLKQLYERFNGGPIPCGRGNKRIRYWNPEIPTKVQSLIGDHTGLNLLNGAVYSGKKTTYTVVTESGKTIRATADHQFKTPEGFFKLSELIVGDNVICKAPHVEGKKKYLTRKIKEIITKLPYSPYKTKVVEGKYLYNRVIEAQLVYDAGINGMSVDEFVVALKTNPDHGFKFSEFGMHIHHTDEDYTHNVFSNLELLSNSAHGKAHAQTEQMNLRFGRNAVVSEKIVSITQYGEEDTYDLQCNFPHNNFVANDFVVHNSGKTFQLLAMALYGWRYAHKVPLFDSLEMNAIIIQQRLAAMDAHKNLTHLIKGMMTTPAFKAMMDQLEANKKALQSLWVVDANLSGTVDGLVMLCRQLKPSACYVDGAYMLEHEDKRLDKFARIGANAEAMKKRIAGNLGIPVVASYQLNRDSTKKKNGKKDEQEQAVGIEDIYGSDTIGQVSSVVLGLLQKEGIETKQFRDVSVLKGRNGESGKIRIHWDFKDMDFSEVAKEETQGDMNFLG